MKCWVPSDACKVSDQIQQARESDIVPVHVLQKFRKVLVQILPQFLSLSPHAYGFYDIILLGDVDQLMLENKLELLFREHRDHWVGDKIGEVPANV